MADLTIIDTDILIDAGRGVDQAIDYLHELEQRTTRAISAVTQMELMVGCRNKSEMRDLDRFLTRFQIIPVNEVITTKTVELLQLYRLSHGLLIADALIAATAMEWQCAFVSKNQRDYRFIANLDLQPYP